MIDTDALASLHRANRSSRPRGVIRRHPDDFKVREILSFVPSGQGEHRYLEVRKRGHNTQWVARALAAAAKVNPRDIGFAGHKDRHGITTQWFSVAVPTDLALSPLPDGIDIVDETRHGKKLKRGALRGNAFAIVVRDLQCESRGNSKDGQLLLDDALGLIGQHGFPNYFGEQRFGKDSANLRRALDWFVDRRAPRGRSARSFALSAARSELFNRALSWRIEQGSWCKLLTGDLAQLSGTQSIFPVEEVDLTLSARLLAGDIHPTGPLWGSEVPATNGDVHELELRLQSEHPELANGLAQQRLRQERRALRAIPGDLSWSVEGTTMSLRFELPRGSYATALLREIIDYEDCTKTGADTADTEEVHA